tara:strand:+ start:316 stop:732 length:417 start_codon:yes stop_codon:yes gene_type:complete
MSIPITEYRNAKSYAADNSRIDVEINHPDHGWIPYSCNSYDTDMTINNDDLLALIGDDFEPYVAPTQEELDAKKALDVRELRDHLLQSEVDPIVSNPLRWAEMSSEKQAEWAQYRTDLLNVPQQSGFPNTISWPTKPE